MQMNMKENMQQEVDIPKPYVRNYGKEHDTGSGTWMNQSSGITVQIKCYLDLSKQCLLIS